MTIAIQNFAHQAAALIA